MGRGQTSHIWTDFANTRKNRPKSRFFENYILGLDIRYTVKYTPWAWPSGTLSGEGLYLTVYHLFRPNTDTILCNPINRYFLYA